MVVAVVTVELILIELIEVDDVVGVRVCLLVDLGLIVDDEDFEEIFDNTLLLPSLLFNLIFFP